MYFINGMFWPTGTQAPVLQQPVGGAGSTLQFSNDTVFFHGVIDADPTGMMTNLRGAIIEGDGPATLSEVSLSLTTLSFTKIYDGDGDDADKIRYTLTKGPFDVWSGTYDNGSDLQGNVRCMLTPIPGTFISG